MAFDLFAGRFEARVASLVKKELQEASTRLNEVALKLEESLARPPLPVPESILEEVVAGEEQGQFFEVEEDEVEKEVDPEPDTEDEDAELDPPAGIGLRFDEIEEMIDEVLSIDDS